MDPASPLTTERLVLRPFTPGDLPALTVLHAEESFWWYPLRSRHVGGGDHGLPLPGDRALRQPTASASRRSIDRASGTMIGWAGLAVPHFLPEILPAVEVGWRLAGPLPGAGSGHRGGAAAVDWGFTEGGLDRIVSIYEPENVASGRVMERLGFTHRAHDVGPARREVPSWS